jgi:hypothetical protein
MKRALLLILSLSFPPALLAQQGQIGIDGLQFVAPMQIAIGRDDNFLADVTDPKESIQPGAPVLGPSVLDDQFFLLRLPKVAYQYVGRRYELTATWVPEFEVFQHNGELNAFNQQATVSLGYYPARNVQIMVGDNYLTSHDPTRTLQNVLVLLPRSPYRQNDIRASVEYQPSRLTTIGVRFDNATNRYGRSDPLRERLLDTRATGYSIYAARLLNRNHRIRAYYSAFKVSPIDRKEQLDEAVDAQPPFERLIHTGGLQYRAILNRNTAVSVSAGVARLDTGPSYTFRGGIQRRIATYYQLTAAYARTLGFSASTPTEFAQGLRASSVDDVIVARFSGQPARNIGILGEITLFRAVSGVIDAGKGFMSRARFDRRLSDRTVFFASWESYHQSRNVFVDAPLSRNRYTVGLEISLSNEAQRRTNPLNEDALYVALTDHARRRFNAP